MTQESPRFSLDDLARQLADAIPANIRGLGDDLQRNFKSLLHGGLARMDLVTREEFDVQVAVLARTRAKLDEIEHRLAALETPTESVPD
jgi:BMFP domain-containing protein YqiC